MFTALATIVIVIKFRIVSNDRASERYLICFTPGLNIYQGLIIH